MLLLEPENLADLAVRQGSLELAHFPRHRRVRGVFGKECLGRHRGRDRVVDRVEDLEAEAILLQAEIDDLAKVAAPILSVEGQISWSERFGETNTSHPEIARIAKALAGLKGARGERAKQFFAWCLVEQLQPANPAELERQIEACVNVLREREAA